MNTTPRLSTEHPAVLTAHRELLKALERTEVKEALALTIRCNQNLRVVLKRGKNNSVRLSLQIDDASS